MKRRTKNVWMAWYKLRKRLGLRAWYHSAETCHDHWIPRFHRIDLDDERSKYGVELCGKGAKDYFTGERIVS